jgi:hypothetical protein
MAATPTSYNLYPLNDFTLSVSLKDVDPTSGSVVPLTSGTVTAFLATSKTASATAADPTLSVLATSIGGGKWLIAIDAAALTPTLLDTLFASTSPFLIVQQPGNLRVFVPLTYVPQKPGILT